MARQIIVLERRQNEGSDQLTFRVALWATVPSARRAFYANPAATSAVKPESVVGVGIGITDAELADLRSGKVREDVIEVMVPNYQTAKPDLEAAWANWDAEVRGVTAPNGAKYINEFNRYGSAWDGTTWVDKSN